MPQKIVAFLRGEENVSGEFLAQILESKDPYLYRVSSSVINVALNNEMGDSISAKHIAKYRRSIASHMMKIELLKKFSGICASHNMAWMPIKGMFTGQEYFESAHDRPTGDIDLLIHFESLPLVMKLLEKEGFKPLHSVDDNYLEYLDCEGYNVEMVSNNGLMLDLHFRLWGMLGSEFHEGVWAAAEKYGDLGETAYKMSPEYAYVLSAAHSWSGRPPKTFLYLWELIRILESSNEETADEIVILAEREGLQLSVLIPALEAGRLWDCEISRGISKRLQRSLKVPEKIVFLLSSIIGYRRVSFKMIYLARLLSKRPCRMGWKSVLRMVQPHSALRN